MRTGDEQRSESGRVLVVGSDAVGVHLARALPAETTFVGLDDRVVERADSSVARAVRADPRRFDVADTGADTAIVATPTDSQNLLYAQRLSLADGVSTVIARVNDPQYHDVFAAIGADTVCGASAVSESLSDTYTRSLEHDG